VTGVAISCPGRIYAEDHNPPHVHVIGPDFQAKVRIADAEVFAGAIPPRHRREALSWISANRDRLMESGMSSSEEQGVDTLPRIKSVSPARAPWTLRITWADRTKDQVDLTGLVHRSRHFRIFLDQPAAFRKVRVADYGGGIEWANGLDYGADTLKMMADGQRPASGAELAAFESELNLSTAETAALLGLAERTVRAYRKTKRLPQSVAIAIRTIRASNTLLAAHYRPVGHRARGRPRKEAKPHAA
jgi:Domain of unknown function (DUF4160)